MIIEPILIDLGQKSKKVVAGSFHSYAISEKGVWVWGKNQNSVICPVSKQAIIYKPILMNIQVDSIATASTHSFGWKDNNVYCWGSNINYELGMEDERQYGITQMNVYKEAIETGLSIVEFSCGQTHSLAVLRQNENHTKLFAWGESKSNQLTLDTTNVIPYPVLSEFEEEIKHIYSRSDYNIAICNEGVYSWGKNIFGRLGSIKSNNIERIPTLIPIPQKIVKVGIGIYHSIGITQNGQGYGWGHAFEGQLGIGKVSRIESVPTKMICNQKIMDVACGQLHTVIVLRNGKVMSCGSNKYQGLGHKNVDEMKRSIILQYIEGLSSADGVSCGNRHSLVLTKTGLVYGWGSNKFGQISHGIKTKEIEGIVKESRVQRLGENQIKNSQKQLLKIWKQKYQDFLLKKKEQQKKLLDELQMILNRSEKQ